MTLQPAFDVFDSVGRRQGLLENKNSICIQRVSKGQHEMLLWTVDQTLVENMAP